MSDEIKIIQEEKKTKSSPLDDVQHAVYSLMVFIFCFSS